jgi:hypothetical protein
MGLTPKKVRFIMLDIFYVGVVIVFFALVWGFAQRKLVVGNQPRISRITQT